MRQMNILIQVGSMVVVNPRNGHGSLVVYWRLRLERKKRTCSLLDGWGERCSFKVLEKVFSSIKSITCDKHNLDVQRRTRARIYRPPQQMKWAEPARISIAIPTSSQEFSLGLVG